MMSGRFFASGAFAAAALFSTALSAAPADIGAKTRLRHCGTDTCLQVTGRRSDATAPVLLAGHDVVVQGRHAWRAAVPLDTVKSWLAPFARTIPVQVAGAETKARLPTGLLGGTIDLAFLDVSATH